MLFLYGCRFIVLSLSCCLRLRVLDATHFNLTYYEIYGTIYINKKGG